MKETTKHLSVKAVVDLKDVITAMKNINTTVKLSDNFPELRVVTNFEAEHFAVQINGERINCSKSNKIEIRKVTAGIFKGQYSLIENQDGKFNVYLLHPKGYIQLARDQKIDFETINSLFDKENFAKITAKKLNTFDLDKRVQDYELFCQKLPQCVFNPKHNFENTVLKYFFAGDIKFAQNKYLALIRKSECKRMILDHFTSVVKKGEANYEEETELA